MPGWRTFKAIDDAQAYCDDCWLTILDTSGGERLKVDYDRATKETSLALYGLDDQGETVVDRGLTVRWAEPMETADGLWAVPCPDFDKGDPEPKWPEPRLPGQPVKGDASADAVASISPK